MTVVLRVFLVVGVLTYLAARKPADRPTTADDGLPVRVETTALSAAWNGLSDGARERIVRDGAAEITRQFAAAKPSQDTLRSSDRRPAWRGAFE